MRAEPRRTQSPQKPCLRLSLLWARYGGFTQRREMLIEMEQNGEKSRWLNVQRDALIPRGTDFAGRDYAVGCQHVEAITFHLPD